MSGNVFDERSQFIKGIHHESCKKVNKIREIAQREEINLFDIEDVENLTSFFMESKEMSYDYFLYWMYLIGCHIKKRYEANWVLIHYKSEDLNRIVPAIMNNTQDIWQVGNFCYTYYYLKNRMQGISFETFYRLEIERLIWKPKFKDLNLPDEYLILIEENGL